MAHVAQLAQLVRSQLILLHVADGWAARNFDKLKLAESDEMIEDQRYLDEIADGLRAKGLTVDVKLALGDPPKEILKLASELGCDLIAMGTHGHRLIGDIIHGSTVHEVRHRSTIPILLVRATNP
jgi:nucleotide-binding universal stress UspA family protein